MEKEIIGEAKIILAGELLSDNNPYADMVFDNSRDYIITKRDNIYKAIINVARCYKSLEGFPKMVDNKYMEDLFRAPIDVYIDMKEMVVNTLFLKEEDVDNTLKLIKTFVCVLLIATKQEDLIKEFKFGHHIIKESELGTTHYNKKLHVFKNKGISLEVRQKMYVETTREILIESNKKYTANDYERLFEHLTRVIPLSTRDTRDMTLKIYPLFTSSWVVEIDLPHNISLTNQIISEGFPAIRRFINSYLINDGLPISINLVRADRDNQTLMSKLKNLTEEISLGRIGYINEVDGESVANKPISGMGEASVFYTGPRNLIEDINLTVELKDVVPSILFSPATKYNINILDDKMCNIDIVINEEVAYQLGIGDQFSSILEGMEDNDYIKGSTTILAEAIIYIIGNHVNSMGATGDIKLEMMNPCKRIFVNIEV